MGLHPVQWLGSNIGKSQFFRNCDYTCLKKVPNRAWDHDSWWFGWKKRRHGDVPPNWFVSPFFEEIVLETECDWWHIHDFKNNDIKAIWELSRMGWIIAWATTAVSGDIHAPKRMNRWLSDWTNHNPAYKGPNWKCGQEASIRVLHLVAAALMMNQHLEPERGLIDLIRMHLQRIYKTTAYAIGQQNNHATSEAAALFVGGGFLDGHDPRAKHWEKTGRDLLEKLSTTLIETDGSFSQYSVNYHRVMLDTYSFSEVWRRRLGLKAFSSQMLERLSLATDWLTNLTDHVSGDAPNIGANDGAHLLQISGSEYRDFRSSVQLASALFKEIDVYGPGSWNSSLEWFGIKPGKKSPMYSSRSYECGGFHILRKNSAFALMRYPSFRFRPSQADALHVDFWHNGINVLRDAGTYSYNASCTKWFQGTTAHNTISFDARNQMPILSRFLFGNWLKSENIRLVSIENEELTAAAGYTDYVGAQHTRKIALSNDTLTCHDTISGTFQTATLRWRLAPDNWYYHGEEIKNENYSVSIDLNGTPVKPQYNQTLESRYYLKKSKIPEISINVDKPSIIITKIKF